MTTTYTDGTYTRRATLQTSYPGRGDDVRRDVYITLTRDGLDVIMLPYVALADELPSRIDDPVTRTWDATVNETRSLTAMTVEHMLTVRAEIDLSEPYYDTVPEDTTVAIGQAQAWLDEDFP